MKTIKTSTSSAALAVFPLRSEAANAANAAPTSSRPQAPDSEVIARPRRRSFTAEYKRSVLDQADAGSIAGWPFDGSGGE